MKHIQPIAYVVIGLAVFGFAVGVLDSAGYFSSITRPIRRGFGG